MTMQMRVTAGHCQPAACGWCAGGRLSPYCVVASRGCEACCRHRWLGVWVVGVPPAGAKVANKHSRFNAYRPADRC